MITVNILINGKALFARSARNVTTEYSGKLEEGFNAYKNDDGSIILHKPDHGAVILAKKMLDTIVED